MSYHNDETAEWEKIGEPYYEENPIFKKRIKTYWWVLCCWKPMIRFKQLQLMKCKVCELTKVEVINNSLAICSKCNKKIDMRPINHSHDAYFS